jgi:hypothetical protein
MHSEIITFPVNRCVPKIFSGKTFLGFGFFPPKKTFMRGRIKRLFFKNRVDPEIMNSSIILYECRNG